MAIVDDAIISVFYKGKEILVATDRSPLTKADTHDEFITFEEGIFLNVGRGFCAVGNCEKITMRTSAIDGYRMVAEKYVVREMVDGFKAIEEMRREMLS